MGQDNTCGCVAGGFGSSIQPRVLPLAVPLRNGARQEKFLPVWAAQKDVFLGGFNKVRSASVFQLRQLNHEVYGKEIFS